MFCDGAVIYREKEKNLGKKTESNRLVISAGCFTDDFYLQFLSHVCSPDHFL